MLVGFVPSFLSEWNRRRLVKSTNSNVACRFFARTPSRILRMVYIKISMITVKQIQVVRTSLFLLPTVLGDTRREIQIIKAYANQTMLTPHSTHDACCGVETQIDLLWSDPKTPAERFNCGNFTVFSKPSKLLGHLFQAWHHPPTQFIPTTVLPHFLFGGLFLQMMIVISFSCGRKTAPSEYWPWNKRPRVVQRLTKLNNEIQLRENG